jgi:hypothetical protein
VVVSARSAALLPCVHTRSTTDLHEIVWPEILDAGRISGTTIASQ